MFFSGAGLYYSVDDHKVHESLRVAEIAHCYKRLVRSIGPWQVQHSKYNTDGQVTEEIWLELKWGRHHRRLH